MPTIAEIQDIITTLRDRLHEADRRIAQAQEEVRLHQSGRAGPVLLTLTQRSAIMTGLDDLAGRAPALQAALNAFLT